jgi:hypothetical protein
MDEEQAEDDTMSNSISIDGERVEMSWNEKIEELLKRWSEECRKLSEKHNEASKRKKCIHYGLQIPIIIAPFVLGFSSSFYGEDHDYNRYVNSYGNLVLGILSGVNTFINYGGKQKEHENACNRYNEVCLDIESILIKHKKYRIPADITIERFKQRIESLNKFSVSL